MSLCCLCSRQKIELPLMENVQTIPPPYVVRTVLIYSRHAGQLQFNPSEVLSVSYENLCKFVWIWQFMMLLVAHRSSVKPSCLCATEDAAVSLLFLRRCLLTQRCGGAGGRGQLEGERTSGGVWMDVLVCLCQLLLYLCCKYPCFYWQSYF